MLAAPAARVRKVQIKKSTFIKHWQDSFLHDVPLEPLERSCLPAHGRPAAAQMETPGS